MPQATPCAGLDSSPTTICRRNVLTGETAAQDVHRGKVLPLEFSHVFVNGYARPMPCENCPAKRINFAKPLMLETRPLKTQITQPRATEQTAHGQQDVPLFPSRPFSLSAPVSVCLADPDKPPVKNHKLKPVPASGALASHQKARQHNAPQWRLQMIGLLS